MILLLITWKVLRLKQATLSFGNKLSPSQRTNHRHHPSQVILGPMHNEKLFLVSFLFSLSFFHLFLMKARDQTKKSLFPFLFLLQANLQAKIRIGTWDLDGVQIRSSTKADRHIMLCSYSHDAQMTKSTPLKHKSIENIAVIPTLSEHFVYVRIFQWWSLSSSVSMLYV